MAESLSDIVVDEQTVLETCGEFDLPHMGLIEQQWATDPILPEKIASVAHDTVGELELESVPDGGEIAVGVGSRGIANIPEIVRGTIEGLQDRGYNPFIFPAMGSHGGATAVGQREKLASYDITEEVVGCKVQATMDVVEVGKTPNRDIPIFADANAVAADAIVPINRIKPHTTFFSDVESGLSKMLVIGMGKQMGAKTAHEWAVDWSLGNMIPEIAAALIEELPVIGGIATVEDQYHDTAIVEGVQPGGFLDREAELLESAYDLMPTLPWDEIDVLVFDQMGKDVSGSGMDTNVIGRLPHFYEPEPSDPSIKRIYTRSLTDPSQGNAAGLGNADLVHRDLLEKWDASKTFINGVTSASLSVQRLPPVVETDRGGVVSALSTIGVVSADPESVRMIRATDTQRLQRFYASETLVEAARDRDDLRVINEPEPIEFDDDGALVAPSPAF